MNMSRSARCIMPGISELCLDGLTPTCGSVHVRNGRGYSQTEAVNATILLKGAFKNFP